MDPPVKENLEFRASLYVTVLQVEKGKSAKAMQRRKENQMSGVI